MTKKKLIRLFVFLYTDNIHVLLVAITCSIIVMGCLVAFIIYMRRRMQRLRISQHRDEAGLPHQIILQEEEEEDCLQTD